MRGARLGVVGWGILKFHSKISGVGGVEDPDGFSFENFKKIFFEERFEISFENSSENAKKNLSILLIREKIIVF